jgi:hypothetical protein
MFNNFTTMATISFKLEILKGCISILMMQQSLFLNSGAFNTN